MTRVRDSQTDSAEWTCLECEASGDTVNSVGVAAQHTDNTGHVTKWSQTISGYYGPDRETLARRRPVTNRKSSL